MDICIYSLSGMHRTPFPCQGLGLVKRMSQVRLSSAGITNTSHISESARACFLLMLGCPHRLAGGLLSILPSDRAGGAAVLWNTAFFVARVVVLVRHTVGSGVRGEWGGE